MGRTSSRLTLSEHSFRSLVESSPQPMFVHAGEDEGFGILWANRAMLDLLGYDTVAPLLGKQSLETFVHPDDRERQREHRKRVYRGERASGTRLRWLRTDGAVRIVTATSVSVIFDDKPAYLVTAQDRTEEVALEAERERAETTIRESEERYRALFHGSPLPVCLFDVETLRLVAVNDRMAATYGYSRDELLAMTFRELKLEEDMPSFMRRLATVRTGELDHVGVVRHVRKDRSIIEVDITSHQIEIGGRRYALAIGQDVTKARRMEEALRHAQRMESIGQLAGGVAHDFNNILAVILANANLLTAELEDHPMHAEAQEIEEAALRAADLTRQLLAFGRKQNRTVTPIAVNAVVTSVEKMLNRVVGEHIEMRTDLQRDLGAIQADRSQLEQVIVNLVVNARDAMPDGGSVTIATTNVELDAAGAAQAMVRPGRYVCISFADTGCGMDAETRRHIFEPYFTTKELGKGTGLGLATVFGIVQQSEGGIVVESAPGRGATFRIYLPRIDGATSIIERVTQRVPAIGGSGTILVVEDSPQLRSVVVRMLRELGYTILAAPTGEEALALMQSAARIDLVLTDLVMPGMDGRTLATQIRARWPGTKLAFMSGYAQHASIGTEAGTDEVMLEKPFTIERLAQVVRRALDRSATVSRAQ